jgi:hypothetical protein
LTVVFSSFSSFFSLLSSSTNRTCLSSSLGSGRGISSRTGNRLSHGAVVAGAEAATGNGNPENKLNNTLRRGVNGRTSRFWFLFYWWQV